MGSPTIPDCNWNSGWQDDYTAKSTWCKVALDVQAYSGQNNPSEKITLYRAPLPHWDLDAAIFGTTCSQYGVTGWPVAYGGAYALDLVNIDNCEAGAGSCYIPYLTSQLLGGSFSD